MAEEEKKETPTTGTIAGILPHSTDFQENPDGGNATKIEIDMEKNAPFIAELKQKIDACNDPEVAKKMVEEFEKNTGMSFDKALELAGQRVTVIINGENGEMIVKKVDRDSEEAKSGEIIDDPLANKDKTELKEEVPEPDPILEEGSEEEIKKFNKLTTEAKKDYIQNLKDGTFETYDDRIAYLDKLIEIIRAPRKLDFAEDKVETKEVEHADEAMIKAAEDSHVVETEEPEDPELTAAINAELENAYKDPASLKFTEEEIKEVVRLGVIGDEETVRALADGFNDDIDDILKDLDDPEGRYHDEESRKKAIYDSLAVKVSLKQSMNAAAELTDPAFIQEIFKLKYPDYVERGPTSVIEQFLKYLDGRTADDEKKNFVYFELTNSAKIHSIMRRADKEIFRNIQTKNNTRYDAKAFLWNSFNMYKKYIGQAYEYPPEEIEKLTMAAAESPLTIYLVLFVRFIYKKMCPDFATHKMQRKYFVEFVADMSRPTASLTPEKLKLLDEYGLKMWQKIREIETGLIEYENTHHLNDPQPQQHQQNHSNKKHGNKKNGHRH